MIDEETRKILEKTSYTNPKRYISGNIIEYDIKSANITMMLEKNIINQEYYEYLSRLPKLIREKEVGLAELRNPDLHGIINSGIIESKLKLAETNNILPQEIIRVSNDAVYINRPLPFKYTQFGNVVFKVSQPYNVYMKLVDILIFVSIPLNGNMILTTKGLGSNEYLHENHMLQVIGSVIYYIERSSIQDALNYLSGIMEDYINKKLPIEFYRELNASSLFTIGFGDNRFGILQSTGFNINDIDINYNLYVLRELWSIVLEIYDKFVK